MSFSYKDLLSEDAAHVMGSDDSEFDVGGDYAEGDEDQGSGIKPEDDNDGDYDDEYLGEGRSLRAMAEVFSVLTEDATQESINEAMNVVRLNKQTKMLSLASRTALVLAKKANDPLYAKYAKFNAIRLQLREQIFKKYGSKANSRARQLMTGTAKPLVR